MALVIVPNTPPTWRDRFTEAQLSKRRARTTSTRRKHGSSPESLAAHAKYMREWNRKRREDAPVEWAARQREKALRFRERHPNWREYAKNRQLKHTYGITLERYREMLSEQSGKCAICSKEHREGHRKGLVVDHNHTTGKVRGLLCYGCNAAIGHLREDERLFKTALAYLNRTLSEGD